MILGLTILLFLIAFPCHFVYDTIPSVFTSIFFPVNESIWEHMKLLFTTYLLFGIIEYPILKHFHLDHNNELFTLWVGAIIIIPIFLVLFLPLYWIFGEVMILTFILMFLAMLTTKAIQFYLLKEMQSIQKDLTIISVILIIVCYTIFGLLTYYPLKTSLFYDTEHHKYGIQDYEMSPNK